MSNIISLTDEAAKHIQGIISKSRAKAFRLSVKKSGCSGLRYLPEVIDSPKAGDVSFVAQDNLQVYIDSNAIKYIEGTVLDVTNKSLGQRQLIFNNPQVKSSCGCGESFNVEESNERDA